ncbi:glycosyl transferase family 90 [Plebeiibacterium marinum]|uniref:Glycosyltransferase family 90 protein n=1 Tax=Plebeiibacterium marinum TaxID=2992111 RepID=A0AAE3MF17_9BACT|nr:glycosyl transferase family 90 [Plebeiobacterium marinum]MCW3806400.1 glycosyltransferase family 90 protein [Plebeiobacterium marinum]
MNCFRKVINQLWDRKNKKIKLLYYANEYIKLIFSLPYSPYALPNKLKKLSKYNIEYLKYRINYYNKVSDNTVLPDNVQKLGHFKYQSEFKTYFFDTYRYKRYFIPNQKFSYLFGDITKIPKYPTVVKSRPISKNNTNSILLNLNTVRHFVFINDNTSYEKKFNKIVWRGNVWDHQPQRVNFFKKHFLNPICDIGHINNAGLNPNWIKNKYTINEQLQYKFILSIEGNDVATNLKWIMSSNSIAVMPTPRYETWFMEGTLIPDYHYIHINDDYSDLNKKLNYYINNPDKAIKIIHNAQAFVKQFQNKEQEKLISLLVLQKYFNKTSEKYAVTDFPSISLKPI